jgi:hypothetical protein
MLDAKKSLRQLTPGIADGEFGSAMYSAIMQQSPLEPKP